MPLPTFTSEIDLRLPHIPNTTDPKINYELQIVYRALQILQQELTAAKSRIYDLENP